MHILPWQCDAAAKAATYIPHIPYGFQFRPSYCSTSDPAGKAVEDGPTPPASASLWLWPSSSHCVHLNNEPALRRSLSLSLSQKIITKKPLQQLSIVNGNQHWRFIPTYMISDLIFHKPWQVSLYKEVNCSREQTEKAHVPELTMNQVLLCSHMSSQSNYIVHSYTQSEKKNLKIGACAMAQWVKQPPVTPMSP